MSRCDDWLACPDLTGAKRTVTCADGGNGDVRLHHEGGGSPESNGRPSAPSGQ